MPSFLVSLFNTTTVHSSVFPLDVVAVITVSPFPTALTTPFLTVAIFSFLDFHVIFLSLASEGVISALSWYVSPLSSVILLLLRDISFTCIDSSFSVTVISHVSFTLSSSAELAVTTALPTPTAFIVPSSSTVTASALSDFHFSDLFSAFPEGLPPQVFLTRLF